MKFPHRLKLGLKITLLSVITAVATPAMAQTCSAYKITSDKQIRSDDIGLWVPEGKKIVRSKDKPSMSKKEFSKLLADQGSINLMDCGDKNYYFWKSDKGPVMVKRMKFTCIAIESSGSTNIPAGAPGSGNSNSSCK